ncbi:MAG: tRNA (adenosine(37)-N6)-dimethylallyltransferase MiaA [Pirellulaceae bacterium]
MVDHNSPASSGRDPFEGCLFLTGATASGKTQVGVRLAQTLDAEIASVDSMAIYRGMDIGTAKPTAEQRAEVPHHLIDIVDPCDSFSVAQYREAALAVVDDARQRGKRVVFVGGTPLYLKALLRGIFEGPPADWEFRRAIESEVEEHGVEALHERLRLVDPLSAHKLHPRDKRRLIRAAQVHHVTGKPIQSLAVGVRRASRVSQSTGVRVALGRSRLHQRIDERVEGMFAAGLIDEVETLLARHGQLGQTAGQAVGYREVIEFLQGTRDREETVEAVKAHSPVRSAAGNLVSFARGVPMDRARGRRFDRRLARATSGGQPIQGMTRRGNRESLPKETGSVTVLI